MSGYSSGKFTVDQIGFIQIADTQVLAAVARGEIDLNRIAREELASRGLDAQGQWVGFGQARRLCGFSAPEMALSHTEWGYHQIAVGTPP